MGDAPSSCDGTTIDLLVHEFVRQTTILIAQLATSRGVQAPLAQIANQVLLDLVGKLERQRVIRKVSADMFGLDLPTYRRKSQRMSEGSTERGRSIWEAVLEYLRGRDLATHVESLRRFSGDDETQVKRSFTISWSRSSIARGAAQHRRHHAAGEARNRQAGDNP